MSDVPKVQENKDELKSVKEKNIEVLTELVQTGRKSVLFGNTDRAIDDLSSAASLSKTIYGSEFAEECFASYLWYGRALLQYANEINTVVKINESNDEDESECEDEESDDEDKEKDNNEEVEDKTNQKKTQNGQNGASNSNQVEPEDETTDELMESANDDDASAFLKDAFQILELARIICERKLESNPEPEIRNEWRLKLAEVGHRIGQVYQSDEEYEKSIEEFSNALKIKKELLDEHDRELAELNYHLGKSYFLSGDYAKSISFFESAAKVFEKTIQLLSSTEEDRAKNRAELTEMRQIYQELEDHIQDARDSAKETEKLKNDLKQAIQKVSTISSDEPVNDVSNLIRKRRKDKHTTVDGTESKDEDVKAKNAKLDQ
ncbi:Protein HGV2 [Aphelenchoides besseyi]|nr:Protein HGV2 [Aphelenchoides besseyi]KAI6199389.1 Protein HGV2 [Aphelenchoides besseyi]